MPRKGSERPPEPPAHRPGNIHSRLLVASLSLAVLFLGTEVTIRTWDLYRTWPPVDVVSHLLAGIAVAAFLYWMGIRREGGERGRARVWALRGTLVVALLWEGVELVQEHYWPDPPWLRDVFLWDGVGDVLATMAGGWLAFPVLRALKRRVRALAPMDV